MIYIFVSRRLFTIRWVCYVDTSCLLAHLGNFAQWKHSATSLHWKTVNSKETTRIVFLTCKHDKRRLVDHTMQTISFRSSHQLTIIRCCFQEKFLQESTQDCSMLSLLVKIHFRCLWCLFFGTGNQNPHERESRAWPKQSAPTPYWTNCVIFA